MKQVNAWTKGREHLKLSMTMLLCLSLGACHDSGKQTDTPGGVALNGHGSAENSSGLVGAAAFNQPVSSLSSDEDELHSKGDQLSEAKYIPAPAAVHQGLGPFYNNTSCVGCHRGDGRGQPVLAKGGNNSQLIVKLSLASGGDPEEPGGSIPVPGLGTQMQDQAIPGMVALATGQITWVAKMVTLDDGTAVKLRAPQIVITKADGSRLADDVLTSVRLAPAFIGLGLLEAVSDEWLIANEAASSTTPGRIPGRLNHVWSRSTQQEAIGRFGRKATKALVKDQVAAALALDIGLDNSLFLGKDGSIEASDETVQALSFYIQTLAAPLPRTKKSALALHGQVLFRNLGCAGCHQEAMRTGSTHEIAALRDQEIHPYTDLLLHDMGADLADQRPDFKANGSEWRTPPLWGIGLQQTVASAACFLHDGRAQTLTEAILWHGGQAQGARDGFRKLSAQDRVDLLAFLGSL